MGDVIGQWAYRLANSDGQPTTRAHKIESQIADRLVAHCGRQLVEQDGETWTFDPDRPGAIACKQCPAS